MKGRVKWDEANLCKIEANKPARKKICEPKTPYYPILKEEGSFSLLQDLGENIGYTAHAEALRNALNEVISSGKHGSHNRGRISPKDESDTMEEDGENVFKGWHKMNFKERRRLHYDESWKLRERQHKEDEEYGQNIDEDLSDSASSLGNGFRTIHIDGSDDDMLRTIDIRGS